LIQIISVNKIDELRSVDLYDKNLDLNFEDGHDVI